VFTNLGMDRAPDVFCWGLFCGCCGGMRRMRVVKSVWSGWC